MTVYCAVADCKYNGKDGKCTADEISLSDNALYSVFGGQERFMRCKNFKESCETRAIRNALEGVLPQ